MSPAKTNDTVDTPSIAYDRMAAKWQLIDDLCGGTLAMRAAQQTWLPRETKEKFTDYRVRLDRSILYAALSDTIDKTSARPFSKPVTLQESELLPEQLQGIADDADLAGSSLTEFARACFDDGLKYGKFHILSEYPPVQGPMTLADERRARVRPYFCRISPTDLIGWRSERDANGEDVLTQVRIREKRVEPSGSFGEEEASYVRVIEPGGWRLYRKGGDDKDFVVHSEGGNSLGRVPLVTVYFDRTGYLEADPTFEDLAWLNLAHWQSYSDQRNLLRVARVPILYGTGLNQTEYEQGLTVGMSNLLKSTNPDAKFGFVEHSGSALSAGDADLKSLEERMEVLGLQPLISRSGGVTATAKSMDEARSSSDIQAWIRASETGLYQAYEMSAKRIGAELPEGFTVDIFSEFSLSLQSAEDVQTLLALYTAGTITAETLLTEIKRRGILSEMVDTEKEAQEVRDNPPLASFTSLAGDDDADEDEDGDEAA